MSAGIKFTDEEVRHIKSIYDSLTKEGRYSQYKQAALSEFTLNSADNRGQRDFVTECWISSVIVHLINAGYEVRKKDE